MDEIEAEVLRIAYETADVWRCLRLPPRICAAALGDPMPGPPYKVGTWDRVVELLVRHISERNMVRVP